MLNCWKDSIIEDLKHNPLPFDFKIKRPLHKRNHSEINLRRRHHHLKPVLEPKVHNEFPGLDYLKIENSENYKILERSFFMKKITICQINPEERNQLGYVIDKTKFTVHVQERMYLKLISEDPDLEDAEKDLLEGDMDNADVDGYNSMKAKLLEKIERKKKILHFSILPLSSL
jgi:hypothetical protein